ncbi:hypothetical protein [Streptomyces sp. NPDC002088]|uniref:hypothetical protein n=1 Tax=Streptomyces sp. NPDC002088 TaxID=3154665 RepID=UPI0033265535
MAGRYEDLRAAVLGGVDGGSRHGWAVLARCGMAAWVKAVARIPVPLPAVRHAPAAVAGELVEVLARMAWTAAGGCRSG